MGLTLQIRVIILFRTERKVFWNAKNKQGSDTLQTLSEAISAHLNRTEGGTQVRRLLKEESERVCWSEPTFDFSQRRGNRATWKPGSQIQRNNKVPPEWKDQAPLLEWGAGRSAVQPNQPLPRGGSGTFKSHHSTNEVASVYLEIRVQGNNLWRVRQPRPGQVREVDSRAVRGDSPDLLVARMKAPSKAAIACSPNSLLITSLVHGFMEGVWNYPGLNN